MSERDDYLWDRSGEPDAEVERLERVLGRLRYEGRAAPNVVPLRPRRKTFVVVTAALVVAAAAGVLLFARPAPRTTTDGLASDTEQRPAGDASGGHTAGHATGPGLRVVVLAGQPRVADAPVGAGAALR